MTDRPDDAAEARIREMFEYKIDALAGALRLLRDHFAWSHDVICGHPNDHRQALRAADDLLAAHDALRAGSKQT